MGRSGFYLRSLYRHARDARYTLLRTLSQMPLPYATADVEEISSLSALHAAGFIEAQLPHPVYRGLTRGWSGSAIVRRLTPAGITALRALESRRG